MRLSHLIHMIVLLYVVQYKTGVSFPNQHPKINVIESKALTYWNAIKHLFV